MCVCIRTHVAQFAANSHQFAFTRKTFAYKLQMDLLKLFNFLLGENERIICENMRIYASNAKICEICEMHARVLKQLFFNGRKDFENERIICENMRVMRKSMRELRNACESVTIVIFYAKCRRIHAKLTKHCKLHIYCTCILF